MFSFCIYPPASMFLFVFCFLYLFSGYGAQNEAYKFR